MQPAAFLSELQARGVTVRAEGDRLRVRGPKQPPKVSAYLRRHKPALLAALSAGPARIRAAPDLAALRLSEFACAGAHLTVRLPALGGALVCLASDNAEMETDARGHWREQVVFRAREWRHLYRLQAAGQLDDDALRLIHETKRTFGGELMDEDRRAAQGSVETP
jgi:hypothetical protein